MGDERIYRLISSARAESPCAPSNEMDRSAMTLNSNANGGLERLRDSDLQTSWSTVNPQRDGDWLEIAWPSPRVIAAIKMALGSRPSDFPIALRVETQAPSGTWEVRPESTPVASAIETLRQLATSDAQASITVRIESIETRAVRLALGRDPERPGWNPWSVAEIHLFSECAASRTPAAAKP
jgi:hypothetical protein